MGFFSGLLGGITSLVGGIFGNRQRAEYAADLNRQSYNQNLDFWNRQNAYNDPSAQMARFKKAGLNPNLIYGQTNMASPIATPEQPSGEQKDLDFLGGLQAFQDLKNSESQNELIQAQKNFAVQQTENSKINNVLAQQANARADAQLELALAQGKKAMEKADAEVDFLRTRNDLGRNDIEYYTHNHSSIPGKIVDDALHSVSDLWDSAKYGVKKILGRKDNAKPVGYFRGLSKVFGFK